MGYTKQNEKRKCLSRVQAFLANIRSTFRSNDPSVASLNVTGLWPFWWNTFETCSVHCTNVSIRISRQWNSYTLRRLIKGSNVGSEMLRRWISVFLNEIETLTTACARRWQQQPLRAWMCSKEITMLFLFSSIYLWMLHLLTVSADVVRWTSAFCRRINKNTHRLALHFDLVIHLHSTHARIAHTFVAVSWAWNDERWIAVVVR